MTDEEFNRIMAQLQTMFSARPEAGPAMGGMLPKMKADIEFHRQAGGRADEMAPVQNYLPSTSSMIGPAMIAPWLPEYDEINQANKYHMVGRMRYGG